MIFPELLKTSKVVLDVECALAEYSTNAREFVMISKSAQVRFREREGDNELFFSVEANSDDESRQILFVDNLTKEMQLWPAVQTNQLTFWGVGYHAVGNDKLMYVLEMDVGRVGQAAVARFFDFLAVALQDRAFVDEKPGREGEPPIPMDDDDFDLGPMGGS